ncbi:response regulator [Oligoflexus tunisiensis]|uniref:response regulator n=1 Tax=Oligoflexus tunisiensis TaxID=708132 RepID=UPI00159F0A56|nr:response regulator [Oligoflexus tunisiensis]
MNSNLKRETEVALSFPPAPRIVLFDDDPFFVRMMEQYARRNYLSLTGVWRMDDIPRIARQDFDLAIIDYDLGDLSGIEVAEFLEEVFDTMPFIMISHSQRWPDKNQPWPRSVRNFVLKENGPAMILDTALEAYAFSNR